MNNYWGKRIFNVTIVVVIYAAMLFPGASAQQKVRKAKTNAGLAHVLDLQKRFGRHFSTRLSAGGASVFQSARMLSKMQSRGTSLRPGISSNAMMSSARSNLLSQGAKTGGRFPVMVNNSSFDFDTSRFTGFTQNETSSAWCGNNIVAGFNDSAAFAHTDLQGQAPAISLSGVAVSHDGGNSFVELPFLNPGPAINPGSPFFDSELAGDPVVVCSDAQHFAYSNIQLQIPVDAQGNVIAAFSNMAVSLSSDGGVTWDDPVTAISKDANDHFLDKEWLAVDPQNRNNMYLTYTDFQAHGTESDCVGGTIGIDAGPDVALEMVSSKDGGLTWSAPVRFARRCNLGIGENLSGSQVVVGRRGTIYVAYASVMFSGEFGLAAQILFRRSDDGGATFGPEIVAGTAFPAANPFAPQLQAVFRTNVFPTLAVDNSSGPRGGGLYLAWTDASRNVIDDLLIDFFNNDFNCVADGCGGYAFGDIVFSRSVDGGSTWSPQQLVSPTPANFQGAGRDQFMSGVAVDPRGDVAVCYSDRRNDPNNFLVDHYCSISHDQGATFADVRETPASWEPNAFIDVLLNPVYLGDYDTVTTDATRSNPGFFNTFQMLSKGNPDVFGFKLP